MMWQSTKSSAFSNGFDFVELRFNLFDSEFYMNHHIDPKVIYYSAVHLCSDNRYLRIDPYSRVKERTTQTHRSVNH